MHFEILVEDQSGKKFLDILIPKIIGDQCTFRVHPYKGIGRIPKTINSHKEAKHRILLEQIPRLLRGYGKTFSSYSVDCPACLIVVCDLDNKSISEFKTQLNSILYSCHPQPETCFCFAVEEGESWLLGDINAIKIAYPQAKDNVLNSYVNDSICGAWEKLADAVYNGGSSKLSSLGWHAVGAEKSVWAEKISPHMDINNNLSPSFNYFRRKLLDMK